MLDGLTALVTGASGPIGRTIADRLAEQGANVALQYRRQKPGNLSPNMRAVDADLLEIGFEADLLGKVNQEFGPLDMLVNCAADQALNAFDQVTDTQMAELLRVNVGAVLSLSRAFVMQVSVTAHNPSILNISSIEAQVPAAGHGHYAASKAALDSLTRSFAAESGKKGVRTNALAPGLINRNGLEKDWPQGVMRWRSRCPLKRMGTPEDVANAALFLLSDKARWINGTVLNVDGGMLAAGGF